MFLDEFYRLASFKRRRAGIYFLLVFLPSTFASACSQAASAPALMPVTVQLSWMHQAEFAGFYTAEEQGYLDAMVQTLCAPGDLKKRVQFLEEIYER